MRWLCVLMLLAAGCATSLWERHRAALAEYEARGDTVRASREARWLIDNAFVHAPPAERSSAAEAKRYLRFADLAAKNDKPGVAVEALREALTIDPNQASAVRAQLERLPVSPAERERFKAEFNWNIAALAPHEESSLGEYDSTASQCWSYQVRELRIRHRRTVKTPDGMQRQVTYDARAWTFDMNTHRWYLEGDWIEEAGAETQLINGPDQPRYQAVNAADHQFYTDDTVPPCHRKGWQGPYDSRGTVFVATRLPMVRSEVNQ